jgi:hypothetical protein
VEPSRVLDRAYVQGVLPATYPTPTLNEQFGLDRCSIPVVAGSIFEVIKEVRLAIIFTMPVRQKPTFSEGPGNQPFKKFSFLSLVVV